MIARRTSIIFAVTDPVTAITFLRGQLAYLEGQGFDCHVACAATPELTAFAESEGATVLNVPLTRGWLRAGDLVSVVRAVCVLRRQRPEVLNYSTPKAALVWAIASWFAPPTKVVFLLRGLRLEGQRRWSVGFAILWLMELVAARSADVTIAVSAGLRRRALELRLVRPSTIRVLGHGSSNGVDTKRFSLVTEDERRRARQALNLAPETFVVGYVGRFARDKGVEDLLRAVASCASDLDLRCLLVGHPEGDFDVNRVLTSVPAAARVTDIRPATSHIERELAAFDVLVLPSYREGMSNALLEAQARGLPCITTDATGCADAISPGETGLVVPVGSVNDLAGAIRRLAAGRPHGLGRAMGLAGRKRVSTLFRSERVWDLYADLYRSASAPSTRRSEHEHEATA